MRKTVLNVELSHAVNMAGKQVQEVQPLERDCG